jgi:branched-chain amino acid transport system permease protein
VGPDSLKQESEVVSLLANYSILLVHGLVYGMLLFLVASGLTLVLGMMNVLNIAHGAFYMLGAYIAYSFIKAEFGFWYALATAPVIIGLLGILVERVLLRRAHHLGHFHELLLSFGLLYVLIEIARWIWGSTPQPVAAPPILTGSIRVFSDEMYPVYRLFILGVSTIILIGLVITINKTRIGVLIRASIVDSEMVNALGTNIPMLFLLVVGAGSALAALAGVIAAPFLAAYPTMAVDILMDCFVVIVIGGFGSIWGALLAALMIGFVLSFGAFWIPQFTMVLEFGLMAIILIIKPAGLFGATE